MSEDSRPRGNDMDLLEQFELILERDNLIDEVGFIHPTQFATLDEDSGGSQHPPASIVQSANGNHNTEISEFNVVQYDKEVFWNCNHKLAISTQALSHLYSAALHAYMDVSKKYKGLINLSAKTDPSDVSTVASKSYQFLESEVLRHTKALLILSCDFGSAWNSRKLVISRKLNFSLFMDEFQLSTLILSYSPKSEYAWSHRRWLIKMTAKEFQNLQEIVEKESELVKTIAEKSKMNFRAWNHRCWLVLYMTRAQVLDELKRSKRWAELHMADNCVFHYRRRLMLRLLQDNFAKQNGEIFPNYISISYLVWKEELEWNELLIERYVGREALWVHRRFLSECWIKHFTTKQHVLIPYLDDQHDTSPALDVFLGKELQLFRTCLNVSADEFEDTLGHGEHAASYILWISKQISLPQASKLQEKLREIGDLKAILIKTCPEKILLWESLMY